MNRIEGEIKIPLLPDKALSDFLKPELRGLEIGDMFTFKIVGPHTIGQTGDTFGLPVEITGYTLAPTTDEAGKPVQRSLQEGISKKGSFSLNKTTAKAITTAVKSRNTDDWLGVSFKGIVTLGRNPQSNTQIKTWVVDNTSIHVPKKTAVSAPAK